MCYEDKECSGIMVGMSRCAGTCVGTVAATGKKISDVVGEGVSAVGNLLLPKNSAVASSQHKLKEVQGKTERDLLVSGLEQKKRPNQCGCCNPGKKGSLCKGC